MYQISQEPGKTPESKVEAINLIEM